MTTASPVSPPIAERGVRTLSAEAGRLSVKYPPRPAAAVWETTCQDRAAVLSRLLAPPFTVEHSSRQNDRRLGIMWILDWLATHPGDSWQQRWHASITGWDSASDWREPVLRWLKRTRGLAATRERHYLGVLGVGLVQLIVGDVIRPALEWLSVSPLCTQLAAELARSRDPAGFAALSAVGETSSAGPPTARAAVRRIAIIVAVKGGMIGDITVGDCLELLEVAGRIAGRNRNRSPYFYQMLHAMGVFPADAPSTMRMLDRRLVGQLTVEQLIDRYDITCRPVRDLLVDYLHERQLAVDHQTLRMLALGLGMLFWKDLENHHPGIDSLHLAPDIAAAWKQRLLTKKKTTNAAGQTVQATMPRSTVANWLNMVRACYLDIAQWAAEDPGRWGPWVAPCPIGPISHRKERAHRKSRMDQRTRERILLLPTVIAAIEQARKETAERLATAQQATSGREFTAAGQRLTRVVTDRNPPGKVWAEESDSGRRRNLTPTAHSGHGRPCTYYA